MKRCPECRRDYYDDSLLYCLDDGSALLEGPTSLDEADTAILPLVPIIKEPVGIPTKNLRKSRTIAVAAVIFSLVLLGTGSYFFYSRRSTAAIDSIAILPLLNESGNPDLDYLSDGVTETLINNFAGFRDIRVVPRSTAFHFKGQAVDPETVGKQLAVRAVITGRIVQRGDMLNAQIDLTDVDRNAQLWGKQFDLPLSDAVSVQKQISAAIFDALRLKLSDEQQEHIATVQPNNSDAYLLYLKGNHQTSRYTKDSVEKGLYYFDQAVASDRGYALAYNGIAVNYIAAADWFLPAATSMPKAGEAARKALEIDDRLSQAHTSLAIVHWWYYRKYDLAESEFRRAIDLDPNESRSRAFFGWFLITMGRTTEAISQIELAAKLDPLSAEITTIVGAQYYYSRRYDMATTQLKASRELDPSFWLTHCYLGRTYFFQGQIVPAIDELKESVDLEPNVAESKAALAIAYAKIGRPNDARQVFDSLQMESDRLLVPRYIVAKFYVAMGEKDRAFQLLDEAIAENSVFVTWLKVDPELDDLRNDSRFGSLLTKAGFSN